MYNKFKFGDRVKVIDEIITREKNIKGHCGTVIGVLNDWVGVEFDKNISGHNCAGSSFGRTGKHGHCWNCKCDKLELVNKSTDRVIFKDNATILFKDGKKYVAKCCEGDTYDREKGLLVCLAKANGITFNDLQEMLNSAEDYNTKTIDLKSVFDDIVGSITRTAEYLKEREKQAVKKVKRKAKVGEYIKVVDAMFTHDYYNNGDIIKVEKVGEYNGYVSVKNGWSVAPQEYVVLENYKPSKYKITLSEFWKSKHRLAIKYNNKEQGREILNKMLEKGFYDKQGTKNGDINYYDCILNDKHNHPITINKHIERNAKRVGYKIYNFDEVDLNN